MDRDIGRIELISWQRQALRGRRGPRIATVLLLGAEVLGVLLAWIEVAGGLPPFGPLMLAPLALVLPAAGLQVIALARRGAAWLAG